MTTQWKSVTEGWRTAVSEREVGDGLVTIYPSTDVDGTVLYYWVMENGFRSSAEFATIEEAQASAVESLLQPALCVLTDLGFRCTKEELDGTR